MGTGESFRWTWRATIFSSNAYLCEALTWTAGDEVEDCASDTLMTTEETRGRRGRNGTGEAARTIW